MTLFIRTASAVAILWAFAMAAEPPEPESLTQLRSAYLDKQADALKPVQQWYLEGLERLERALVQRGDVPGAAKVREERTTVEQPALVIVKAFWGTKEATTDITRRLQG
ncbi:MAG: hypothetical protein U0984_05460, partial [Prosthecobacter sp.]|nr:hypothetical protein [Prosthecobacter sp.]